MEIRLKKAELSDMERLWRMQIEAFAELLQKYQDMDTNPGNESYEKVISRYHQPQTTYYFILDGNVETGAIRIVDFHDDGQSKRISPIFVLPEYQNRGIAQQAIIEAELIHGKQGWALDTILQETRNCYLYEKMGYHRTGIIERINDKLTLVYYEKI